MAASTRDTTDEAEQIVEAARALGPQIRAAVEVILPQFFTHCLIITSEAVQIRCRRGKRNGQDESRDAGK
jgi:hypothetical protein